MSGTLYVVASPIGNLMDITFRAVEVLKSCDLIVAEDTRRTKILLDHYDIRKPTISANKVSEIRKASFISAELDSGKNVALLTDAGTPAISDPGAIIVDSAHRRGIKVVPIPGPCAVTALASVSGINSDRLVFEGFLPKRKSKLRKRLRELLKMGIPFVIFESPNRVVKTFRHIEQFFGAEHEIVVGREITKQFEEIVRIKVANATAHFQEKPGEYTILVPPKVE